MLFWLSRCAPACVCVCTQALTKGISDALETRGQVAAAIAALQDALWRNDRQTLEAVLGDITGLQRKVRLRALYAMHASGISVPVWIAFAGCTFLHARLPPCATVRGHRVPCTLHAPSSVSNRWVRSLAAAPYVI